MESYRDITGRANLGKFEHICLCTIDCVVSCDYDLIYLNSPLSECNTIDVEKI